MSRESNSSASTVLVGSGAGAYPVLIAAGLLDRLPALMAEYVPAHRYVIISDDHVAALYGEEARERCARAGLRTDLVTFPRGEASKNRTEWGRLTDRMLDLGHGRDSAIVALGGGVTGDLAGFVAATYLRGIPVLQVPTSLVAMIDASVGGKTGVDVEAGKNLVGAFHPPRAVVIDPLASRTLDRGERAQGLAEAVKHGAILDTAYFSALEGSAPELLEGDPAATLRTVVRSVQLKARVVSDDEHERGLRQILNFGHTIGHALEAAADYRMGHGSAVAAGMILEAVVGERMGVTEEGTAERLGSALQRFGLGRVSSDIPDAASVTGYLGADKKARGGHPRYVLLERVGAVAEAGGWSRTVPEDMVRTVVREALDGRDPERHGESL